MKIEIDQSGKIEKTNKHTFLAFSNGEHFVIKISSTEKQKIQKYFNKIKKPRMFIYITFASLIAILLDNLKQKSNQIIVDTEYPGQNFIIKKYLKILKPNLCADDIDFRQIGKKSRAHFLAYGTAIDKLNPDKIIDSKDVFRLIKKIEKCLSS